MKILDYNRKLQLMKIKKDYKIFRIGNIKPNTNSFISCLVQSKGIEFTNKDFISTVRQLRKSFPHFFILSQFYEPYNFLAERGIEITSPDGLENSFDKKFILDSGEDKEYFPYILFDPLAKILKRTFHIFMYDEDEDKLNYISSGGCGESCLIVVDKDFKKYELLVIKDKQTSKLLFSYTDVLKFKKYIE